MSRSGYFLTLCYGWFVVTVWRNWVDLDEEIRVRIHRREVIQNRNTRFSSSAIFLEPALLTACQVNDGVWNCVLSGRAVFCISARSSPSFPFPDGLLRMKTRFGIWLWYALLCDLWTFFSLVCLSCDFLKLFESACLEYSSKYVKFLDVISFRMFADYLSLLKPQLCIC